MEKCNLLIIGGGGREHALAWKLSQSPLAGKLFVAPGNPGSASVATNVDVDVAKAEEAANAANAIKQECEDALAEALPILVRTSSKLHRKAAICALSIAGQILEYFKHASPRQHCELVIFSGSSTGSFGYHQGRRHQACPEL
jgi:hypothetical protein